MERFIENYAVEAQNKDLLGWCVLSLGAAVLGFAVLTTTLAHVTATTDARDSVTAVTADV